MEPPLPAVVPDPLPLQGLPSEKIDKHGLWVFLFFLCLFLLTSSGRLGNWDPLAQLQAATALVSTGQLGVVEDPMPAVPSLWNKSADGRYYQAHDLGGTLFMVPAAAIGIAVTRHRTPIEQIREPAWAARALTTLQYAALAAVGCWALYRLFVRLYPPQNALLLTLLFAGGTTYWAYARIAYDILGACVGICLLLMACAETLQRPTSQVRDAVRIILAFLMACTFRFSLTPFLILGLIGVIFLLRHRWSWKQWMMCGALVGFGLLASLVYNYVRTGAVFKNGATGSAPVSAALHGNFAEGLYGLLISPNWGLLWYCPLLLLIFVLPFTWKQLPLVVRQLFICFTLAAVPYTLTIAHLNNWTGFSGWGPRYLVPFLPVLFLPVAALLMATWDRYKWWFRVLVLLTLLVNLPALVVNYRLAIDGYPGGREWTATVPRQQFAVWSALGAGLRHQPLAAPAEIVNDPIRSLERNFPDWWTVRLIELSPVGAALGIFAQIALLTGGSLALRAFLITLPTVPAQKEGRAG